MASSPAPLGAAAAVLRFPGAAAGTLRPPKSSSAPVVPPGEHRVLPFTAQAVTSSSTSASGNGLGICGSHQQPPPQSGGCRDSDKIVIASYTIRVPGYSATGVSVRTDILHLLSLYDVGSPTELKEKPIGLNVLLDLALRDERSRPLSR